MDCGCCFDLCLVFWAAHSSLDRYFADWLGLDQSRYQWALNDYYENNGSVSDSASNTFFWFLLHCLIVFYFFVVKFLSSRSPVNSHPSDLFAHDLFYLGLRVFINAWLKVTFFGTDILCCEKSLVPVDLMLNGSVNVREYFMYM